MCFQAVSLSKCVMKLERRAGRDLIEKDFQTLPAATQAGFFVVSTSNAAGPKNDIRETMNIVNGAI